MTISVFIRMKNTIIRATVISVALFFMNEAYAESDFTTNALVGYLTGIPSLYSPLYRSETDYEYPAELARDYKPYLEIAGNSQEVFRSLIGDKKYVNHGSAAVSLKYPLIQNRAGIYLSYNDYRSSVLWPFSDSRITLGESYESGKGCFSAYVSVIENLRVGVTVGKQLVRNADSTLQIVEISGGIPFGLHCSLRYFSIPYNWGINMNYANIKKILSSQFRHYGYEGEITYPVKNIIEVILSGKKRSIDTSRDFRGVPNNHAQGWNVDGDGWQVRVRKTPVSGVAVIINYGRDTISGKLDLWYNNSQYMRGIIDSDTYRFGTGTEFNHIPRYFPDFRYDRVSTDLTLRKGIAYSWPFTPKIYEIIGDKTWTFSGTGRIVSDSGTFSWKLPSMSWMEISYIRSHLDYSLRITTRDHLSTNPMDIIFGKTRIENDRTRYYDFALISYRKSLTFERFSTEFSISQFIPIYHSEKKIPGRAPVPPSFPKIRVEKPKYIGGLSFNVKGRLLL